MIRFLNFRAMLYVIFSFISVVLVVGIAKNMYQQYMVHGQILELQAAIEKLQKNNQSVSQLIQSFQQESTIELEGRNDLNLQKPGEQTVIIIPPKNYPQDAVSLQTTAASSESSSQPADDSFSGQIARRTQLWWKFIFQ